MIVVSILSAIIILSVFVFVQYIIAKEFYSIAVTKGYNNKKYFWICFLLGMCGYLLVIALPINIQSNSDTTPQEKALIRKKEKNKFLEQFSVSSSEKVVVEEKKEKVGENEWKCKNCGKILPEYVGSCSCGNIQRDNKKLISNNEN